MRGLARLAVVSLGCMALAFHGGRAAAQEDPKNHYILECGALCDTSALEQAIGLPHGITTDGFGGVYFASQHIVFKLMPNGTLAVVAGTGKAGYAGDGGRATEATLNIPWSYPELENDDMDYFRFLAGLAVDGSGRLHIADVYNNRVRRVNVDGTIDTVADASGLPIALKWPAGLAFDDRGGLVVVGTYGTIVRSAADGALETLTSNNCGEPFLRNGACVPQGVAADSTGAIYFTDLYCRVRKWTRETGAETIAGDPSRLLGPNWPCGHDGDGGPALLATLSMFPYGIARGHDGRLFVADTHNHCIRVIDTAGIIGTHAGVCGRPALYLEWIGEGVPATQAVLREPMGVAVDLDGNLYIADTGNRRIRKVGTDGIITTVAGNGESLP